MQIILRPYVLRIYNFPKLCYSPINIKKKHDFLEFENTPGDFSKTKFRFFCEMKLQRVGDYLLGEKLGEGSFAKVRVGLHVISREKVSKIFCPSKIGQKSDFCYRIGFEIHVGHFFDKYWYFDIKMVILIKT